MDRRGVSSHLGPAPALGARIDTALFTAFLGFLAWTPFWFGSDRSLAWSVNAVLVGVLTCCYELGLLATRRRHPVAVARLRFPAVAFVGVVLWALLQTTPILPVAYQHPIWHMAREALQRDLPGAISVDPDHTTLALLRFVTCALAFWLSLQLCRSGARARRMVQLVAIAGGVYALYGLLAFFVFPNTILWFEKVFYRESVTSTFVNRNSYATYAGLGLCAALAVTLSLFVNRNRNHGLTASRRLAGLVALTTGLGGAWMALSLTIAIALVMTGSRGGVMASLGGLTTLALLVGLRGRGNAVGAGFGLLLCGLAVGVGFFNYGDFLAERFASQGLASDDRLAVYALTWSSIADAPLFGFGDGTFEQVFPMYRDASVGPFGVWDRAHDSYLEVLQGLGLPIASIFLGALAVLSGRCVYAALTRQKSATAPLAAAAASVVVCLHSFVDFSMQLQAIAITYAALLGAGVAQSWSSDIRTDR